MLKANAILWIDRICGFVDLPFMMLSIVETRKPALSANVLIVILRSLHN